MFQEENLDFRAFNREARSNHQQRRGSKEFVLEESTSFGKTRVIVSSKEV